MSDTPAPCPFCGKSNTVIRLTGRYNTWWTVECQECFVAGPIAGDIAAAVAKWNEREPPQEGNHDRP